MTARVTCEMAGLLAGPVAAAAGRAGLPWRSGSPVPLEPARDVRLGDFTSRAAFRLAGLSAARPSPRRIGEAILEGLAAPGDLLERAELAGPGFLNFTVRRERWVRALAELPALPAGSAPGAIAGAFAADPEAAGEVRAALGRLAGIRRARAAAGAPLGEPAVDDLAALARPDELALVRRAALLPELAACPAVSAAVLEGALGDLARAFRAYDASVRLVTAEARATCARLALACAVERALAFGVRRLGERR